MGLERLELETVETGADSISLAAPTTRDPTAISKYE